MTTTVVFPDLDKNSLCGFSTYEINFKSNDDVISIGMTQVNKDSLYYTKIARRLR